MCIFIDFGILSEGEYVNVILRMFNNVFFCGKKKKIGNCFIQNMAFLFCFVF